MGAYLSTPVTDKEFDLGSGCGMTYAACAMQGWRKNMEDSHVMEVVEDSGVGVFGVFDGHCGREVALYVKRHYFDMLSQLEAFKAGDFGAALKASFINMDERLDADEAHPELAWYKAEGWKEFPGISASDMAELPPRLTPPSGEQEKLKKILMAIAREKAGGSEEAPQQTCKLDDHRVSAGCTAVVAIVSPDKYVVANAGDSRCVLSRNGKAVPLSFDHKPMNDEEYSRIIAAGGFVRQDGVQARINGNLNLSRSIGDLKYKQTAGLPPEKQMITCNPEIKVEDRAEGDEFLIVACDGIWDCLSNQEAVDFVHDQLKAGAELKDATAAMFDKIIAPDPKETQGLGGDNMTCVLIDLSSRP